MFNRKNILCISLLVIAITPIIALVSRSFSASVDEEVKSVTIQSNNYNEPGSWKLEKSAKWLEKNKAEITLNLKTVENNNGHNKDVILIYDDSGSMHGEKMRYAREGSQAVISSILDNPDNRVALILSDSGATIVSDFTNDKVTLNNDLENAIASGYTNYYHALVRVDELLQGYTKEANRDLVVVFIVSCFPFYDSPNEAWKYETLKQKYPYLTINAIQYEMGASGTEEVISMSDRQWIADRNNIREAIYEASLTTKEYEELKIEDYINNDFYSLDSISDIKVDKGEVNVSEEDGLQKVTWNLSKILSGESAKLTINVNLKDEYKELDGLYSTNKKEKITSKINGEEAKSITSELTPKLSNKYYLTYSPNTPEGCNLGGVTVQEYFAYDTVNKRTDELTCEGYLFRGWEVDLNDVSDITIINSDTFLMPGHNVTVRAIWTKQDVNKKMNGTVRENENTLYRVLQDAAIDGTYAREYTGPHQDAYDHVGDKKVYHWYADLNDDAKGNAILNMYNVKFANRCWRMVRTTDTGGVKLFYNGEYDETLKCGSGRKHVKEQAYDRSSINLGPQYPSTYLYGDGYEYDPETKKFTLTGDLFMYTTTHDDYERAIGKYTCRSNSSENCSEMNYVLGKSGNDLETAQLYPSMSSYRNFDVGYGNFTTSDARDSLSALGYMYGDIVTTTSRTNTKTYNYYDSSLELFDGYPYSNYKNGYVSSEIVETEPEYESEYTFYKPVNPIKVSDLENKNQMIGKYYFSSGSPTNAVYYILDVDDDYVYYYRFGWRHDYRFKDLYMGDSITETSNGTFAIDNAVKVTAGELFRGLNNYQNKIICMDSDTCMHPWKILKASNYASSYSASYYLKFEEANYDLVFGKSRSGFDLVDTITVSRLDYINNFDNYKDYRYTCGSKLTSCTVDDMMYVTNVVTYDQEIRGIKFDVLLGSDVTWDGEKYTLVDPSEAEILTDKEVLRNHHFYCPGVRETSCKTVYFATYSSTTETSSGGLYSIPLENGETDPIKVRDSMIKNNVNESFIKQVIELWYENYMTKYTPYLENAVYCNNRQAEVADNGFNSKTGNLMEAYNVNTKLPTYNPRFEDINIKCDAITDRFSPDNPYAQTKYPVGLYTYAELLLFNNRKAKQVSSSFYTGTVQFSGYYASNVIATYDGSAYGSSYYPFIPMISLKYGTQYISGTGTTEDPYVVDTSEVDEP